MDCSKSQNAFVVEEMESRCLMSGDVSLTVDPITTSGHTGGVNAVLCDGSVRTVGTTSWSWGMNQTGLQADPDEGGELR